MRQVYSLFFLGLILCVTSWGRTPVDPRAFFERLSAFHAASGNKSVAYTILSVHGTKPKPETGSGTVEVDGDEATTTFPYCPVGGRLCDGGYNFFPFDKTKVFRSELAGGTSRYEVELDENGEILRFEWEESTAKTIFRKLNYVFDGSQPFTLIYELQRVAPREIRVATRPFFEQLAGGANSSKFYKILKVQGAPPKAETSLGTIEVDLADAIFTFPYCPPGGGLCDPGYEFLGLDEARTEVKWSSPKAGVFLYRIGMKDGNAFRELEWEQTQDSKESLFRKHNYSFGGSAPFTLTYEIEPQ